MAPAGRLIAATSWLLLLAGLACSRGCHGSQTATADARSVVVEDAGPRADFEVALSSHRKLIYRGDLDEVLRRGVLRAITRNNSISYFLFRGDEVGFDYELAQALARELGVRLEIVVAPTQRDLIPWLLEGRGDIVAAGLTVTEARTRRVVFAHPYLAVHDVVVVRRGRKPPLTAPADLLDETVHVRSESSQFKRLRALGDELGQTIRIAALPESVDTEELIDLVGRGEVAVTLVRSNLLDAELTWRDDVEAAFALAGDEQLAWSVRPEDGQLRQVLDAFFLKHQKGLFFNTLLNKYFRDKKRVPGLRDDEVRTDRTGTISRYDELLRQAARRHGLDWRLLAAVSYQESRFDPRARSWAGAEGLLQLMPSISAHYSVRDSLDPAASIEAGARHLRWLIDSFSSELPLRERIHFALAAYNVGRGHVVDARQLAQQIGYNPDIWTGSVDKTMLLLARPRFYRAAVSGYCRGEETVHYVETVQKLYDAYTRMATAD